ncbi:Hint domain-containing protein [Thalassovita taeanensis]|uniref:Hint domain-containing protein n=1 Tax=Thalassovita taeanensis TaxID=657014 RepID=A0A1H9AWU1_9RHOB|nr:Hint domain-containing protein [Thalassovita taeanensis]SEP81254.1 Hint domain-containing protein [Thalassovita taeanensis]
MTSIPPLTGFRNEQFSTTRTQRPTTHHTPRKPALMRRYDVTYLGSSGRTEWQNFVAPANATFESAFSAFARGTLIRTTDGPCAVEDLDPGMMIETHEFGPQPLQWLGSMQIIPNAPVDTPEQTRLTRIMPDTFGIGRPISDLMIGPGARLLRHVPGGEPDQDELTPVSNVVDGDGVFQITPPMPVQVHHLCLPRHATIFVGGLRMESYHPGEGFAELLGPNMLKLFLSLFPHIQSLQDFGTMAYLHSRSLQRGQLSLV